MADFVDRFLDLWYSRLVDPRRLASLCLLVVEAHRVPTLIGQSAPRGCRGGDGAQLEVLRTAVARGQLAQDLILENAR